MKGRKWKKEEDRRLRQVVLETVQKGGTQLEAFRKVGIELGRTSGACGFRWNAVLRKQDPQSFLEAKRQKVYTQIQKHRKPQIESFANLYSRLKKVEKQIKKIKENNQRLRDELETKKEQIRFYEKENERLLQEEHSFQWIQKEVKERYKDLLNIMSQIQDDMHLRRWRETGEKQVQEPHIDSST